MKNVIVLVSFDLNNENLLDEWKKISAGITESLKQEDGFISRYSGVDENGRIHCIIKWENMEKRKAFGKKMEEESFKEKMKDFGRIANMETMKMEVVEVF